MTRLTSALWRAKQALAEPLQPSPVGGAAVPAAMGLVLRWVAVSLGIGFLLVSVSGSVYRSVKLEQQLRINSRVLLTAYDSVRDSYVPQALGDISVSKPQEFQLPIGLMAANLAIQGKRGIVSLSVDDYRSFGVLAYSEQRYDNAIHYFGEVLKRDPADYRALTSLGVTYFQEGELAKSREEKAEWNRKAVEAHQSALRVNSKYVVAYSNLGISLYYLDRKDEAVAAELTAIRLDPHFVEPYYNLACIYSLQNDREAAMQWLEKAIDKGYDSLEEMRTDPTLGNIRGTPRYKQLENLLEEKKNKR